MKAKLIKTKQELIVNYHLKNENGHTIATTLFPVPTEVEYAANSRGIKLQRISLKNCEAIDRGYDLDELANELLYSKYPFHPSNDSGYWLDMYKEGFQKALELIGDKKFTLEDMMNCWNKALIFQTHKETLGEHIQSLQQTEWDVEVEIDEEKEFILDPTMGISQGHYLDKPKLDENGCLILKKI